MTTDDSLWQWPWTQQLSLYYYYCTVLLLCWCSWVVTLNNLEKSRLYIYRMWTMHFLLNRILSKHSLYEPNKASMWLSNQMIGSCYFFLLSYCWLWWLSVSFCNVTDVKINLTYQTQGGWMVETNSSQVDWPSVARFTIISVFVW